jgi:ABC-2 type transport system permease protein
MTAVPGGRALPWGRQLAMLTGRSLVVSMRNPIVAVNAGLAVFFLLVYDGSLGGSPAVLGLVGGNYFNFILPAAVLAASVAGGAAGIALVTDLQSRYLFRQMTMPISRSALVCATILVGGIQVVAQTIAVIGAAILLGADPQGGIVALLVVCLLALLWGLGFAGYSVLVAILTRDAQITSAASIVFLPIIFLSPLLLPEDQLRSWVQSASSINPASYTLKAMRELLASGLSSPHLVDALLASGIFASLTLGGAIVALRRLTRS